MGYSTVNILDLIDIDGDGGKLKNVISSFKCPINQEIEDYLYKSAVIFARKKITITYFVFDDETNDLVGYYALTNKSITIDSKSIPKKLLSKFDRYFKFDNNEYTGPCYLIAQLSKNYAITNNKISGKELLDDAFSHLSDSQKLVGGGFVYLECEADKKKILRVYSDYGFTYVDDRESNEGITYKRLIKKLN